MSGSPRPANPSEGPPASARHLRLAFIGPPAWLDSCCPPEQTTTHVSGRVPILEGVDLRAAMDEIRSLRPHISIVFDPLGLSPMVLEELPGITLGILVGGVEGSEVNRLSRVGEKLDRVVSFRPGLTGAEVGPQKLWRAIPPPISDALFGDVRPLNGRPRVMTIGHSTEYRESMLLATKHHHDLFQVLHGLGGETLLSALRQYDVGVYVPPAPGPGFGAQVGMHLAAGQLLCARSLDPAHGLERGIDYIQFATGDELVWILDRLRRFPEMYQRLRVRGRMKADNYRASAVFDRIVQDLLADVEVFGITRSGQ